MWWDYIIRAYCNAEDREFAKNGTQTVYCKITVREPFFLIEVSKFCQHILASDDGDSITMRYTPKSSTVAVVTLTAKGEGREHMSRSHYDFLRRIAYTFNTALTKNITWSPKRARRHSFDVIGELRT